MTEPKEYYYKLEKLEVDEGETSAVQAGHVITGELMLMPRAFVSGGQPHTIDCVKEGLQVLVTRFDKFVRTSPVKEILETGEDHVKFKTTTSTYLLTRHEEE
jgi:hypothetical protein